MSEVRAKKAIPAMDAEKVGKLERWNGMKACIFYEPKKEHSV